MKFNKELYSNRKQNLFFLFKYSFGKFALYILFLLLFCVKEDFLKFFFALGSNENMNKIVFRISYLKREKWNHNFETEIKKKKETKNGNLFKKRRKNTNINKIKMELNLTLFLRNYLSKTWLQLNNYLL